MGGQPSSPPVWATRGRICGALLPSHGRWGEGGALTGRREPGAQQCRWKLGHQVGGEGPRQHRDSQTCLPAPFSPHHSALSVCAVDEEWRGSERGHAAGEWQGPPVPPGECLRAKAPPRAPQAKAR